MTDTDLVFVYGTLRRGADHPMAERLARESEHVGGATWRGRLYSLGPYPAAVRQAGHFVVTGDVFRLPPDSDLLAALDAYEDLGPTVPPSDRYVREVDHVMLDDGQRVRCWIYRYLGPVAPRAWIPSGDWLLHLAEGSPLHQRSGRRVLQ